MATTLIDGDDTDCDGVWIRLHDGRVLTPTRFESLTVGERKQVQFVPVSFEHDVIGDRMYELHCEAEDH